MSDDEDMPVVVNSAQKRKKQRIIESDNEEGNSSTKLRALVPTKLKAKRKNKSEKTMETVFGTSSESPRDESENMEMGEIKQSEKREEEEIELGEETTGDTEEEEDVDDFVDPDAMDPYGLSEYKEEVFEKVAIRKRRVKGELTLTMTTNERIKSPGEIIMVYSNTIVTDKDQIQEIWTNTFQMTYFYHVFNGQPRIATPTTAGVYIDREFTPDKSNAEFVVSVDKIEIRSTQPIRKGGAVVVYSGPSTNHRWSDGKWQYYMRQIERNFYAPNAPMDVYKRHESNKDGCTDDKCVSEYNKSTKTLSSICSCYNYDWVCDSTLCKCSPDECRNRPFESPFKATMVDSSSVHGMGLFADENIVHDDWIIEYCGEVITEFESLQRSIFYRKEGSNYVAKDKLIIDATRMGNNARYSNHSCSPNAVMVSIIGKNGIPMMCLRAVGNIMKSQEILWDYNEVVNTKTELLECMCSAKGCRKTLNRIKTKEEIMAEKKLAIETERQRKEERIQEHARQAAVKIQSELCDISADKYNVF